MKKPAASLIVPALVLMLTVSSITIRPVTSQDTGPILDKLKELNGKLEGEKPALQHKINAVIHQIESGAFHGALNKLQNDVKKSIIAWVADPEELTKLVDHIIDLIKGKCPPPPPTPDFQITTPPYRLDVIQGGFNTTIITITSVRGFSREVTLSATTSAPEVTITLDPTVLSLRNAVANSILVVSARLTTTSGDYIINVTGVSGDLKHSLTIPLRIIEVAPPPTPDFTLVVSPTSLTIEQGRSSTSVVIVTSVNGFDKPVGLAVTSAPISGVNATLYPQKVASQPSIDAIAILILDIAFNAAIGTYNVIVTGTSGTLQHSAIVSLVITAPPVPPTPDFGVNASPTLLTVEQGNAVSSTIVVTSLRGFDEAVELAFEPESIPGAKLSLDPTRVILSPASFNTTILKIEVALNTLPQELEITVTGTSGALQHSVTILLRIIEVTPPPPAPDFTITASPTALSIEQGHSNTSVITVTSLNGFEKQVDLAVTSAPITGVNATLYPQTVTPQPSVFAIAILILDIAPNAITVTQNITVIGTSGAMQHTAIITLIITTPPVPPAPDFSLNASPATLTVKQEETASSTIIVTSLRGFNESVELTFEPESIIGVTTSLDPALLFLSPGIFNTSILKVEVALDAHPQELEIAVVGKSGTLKHSVTISLKIIVEKKAPRILSVWRMPQMPAYNDTVTVTANVVDFESGVKEVILKYVKETIQENVTMALSAGLYKATIPTYPFSTLVEYQIQALDNAGNLAISNSAEYVVADPYQPLMRVPTWSPQDPIVNDDIVINITVTEPEGASGIDRVILRYSNTTARYSVVMTDNHNGNWTAIIGNQTGPRVSFFVEALDKAGNKAESDILEFSVNTTAFPLVWILAAIAILAAATGGGAYYTRRKRKKNTTATSVPYASLKPISPRLP